MDHFPHERYRGRVMGACGHLVTADIGRHRLFVATTQRDLGAPSATSPALDDLDDLDGLILRWCDEGRRRFGERVTSLAGVADDLAAATCADVAGLLTPLTPMAPDDGSASHTTTHTTTHTIAIPASFGPRCRAAVIEGFASAGIRLGHHDLVERPVAAAAGWLAHREDIAGRLPNEPVLVIDNDAGEVSVAALDPATKRLLFVRPLSTGPFDRPGMVMERLRDAIETTARLTHRGALVRETDWATVSASIGDVVVTGCGAKQPMLHSLIAELLPAAHVMPDPVVASERAVITGLSHLDRFDGWTACWPTLPITIDETTAVQAGQVLDGDPWNDSVVGPVTDGATLGFGQLSVSAGSCHAAGVRIPAELATELTIRTLDDGRVLLLGAEGAMPLALQPAWPCPGRRLDSLPVRTIGRRALEFSGRAAPADPQANSGPADPQAHNRLTTSSQS